MGPRPLAEKTQKGRGTVTLPDLLPVEALSIPQGQSLVFHSSLTPFVSNSETRSRPF